MKKAFSFSLRTSKKSDERRLSLRKRLTRDATDIRIQDRHFWLPKKVDRNHNIYETNRPQSILYEKQKHDIQTDNFPSSEDDPKLLPAFYLLSLDEKERTKPLTFETFRPPAARDKDYTKRREEIDLRYLYICKAMYLKKVENSEFDWMEK